MVSTLFDRLMQGVVPGSPGAMQHLLANAATVIPWTALIWFTLASIALGVGLGWWRGRVIAGLFLALIVGPIGLAALWAAPPGKHGPARKRLDERNRIKALREAVRRLPPRQDASQGGGPLSAKRDTKAA